MKRQCDGHTHNMKISLDNVGTTQHGVYDSKILCKDCDNKLGKYDHYALDVCRRFPRDHITLDKGMFEMADVDGDIFSKFVLSVLWRASITSRPEFRKVMLNTYESEVCEVIFGAKPLRSMASYELLIARYTSVRIDPERSYTFPARSKIDGLDGWIFALGGFRVIAKMDPR